MLTKNEITTLNLSPTKKDFVQIWNELLEVAGKLSERWDPTSTNESDPGIVILKALTGIADKLNYNIDKNTLEAFMPTAAQEDSMRKLCDMLGYSVKYYRSAETDVTIKYYNANPSEDEDEATSIHGYLAIPKFTVITNSDKDINYFTNNEVPVYISKLSPSVTIPCMEGQIVKCESNADNNVITPEQISENNRFYLPEYQIAENGIFVYNVFSDSLVGLVNGTPWTKVDNLNIQARGERVFKFGYDSYESRPYIEFPVDYSELINDGLFIYYARTSGASGNISPRTLTQLELPSGEYWSKVSTESFSAENTFAATSGANIETIKQAYNNFKKTVGTFETLVTCRDYMNKIYTLTNAGKPIVSNILVTDIRNDLNRASTICSCDDAGIFYKETPLTTTVEKTLKISGSNEVVTVEDTEPAISHFDLVLYPFKSFSQIRGNVRDIQDAYDSSFKCTSSSNKIKEITAQLDEIKTIAHNFVGPRKHDIVSINNYLRLSAIIGTNSKITVEEGELLKETIKIALANAFNMRELDFGEEIPFESIVEVIEKADSRIKIVSLNEPALYTTYSVFEGNDEAGNAVLKEYAVASDWLTVAEADATGRFDSTTFNTKTAKEFYNKLAVRNILAGRVPLFKYNNTFSSSFSDNAYRITTPIAESDLPNELPGNFKPTEDNPVTLFTLDGVIYAGQYNNGNPTYTKSAVPDDYANNIITKTDDDNITEIETECVVTTGAGNEVTDVTLASGEFIKFRAPNFITTKTYPAYVNYHLALQNVTAQPAEWAQAKTLYELVASDWSKVFNSFSANHKKTFTLTQTVKTTTSEQQWKIENPEGELVTETPATILAKSSCIKVGNEGKPDVQWSEDESPNLNLDSLNLSNLLTGDAPHFITNAITFDNIKNTVNSIILNLSDKPEKAWTISYTFEYIPFDAGTLEAWETFVRDNLINKTTGTNEQIAESVLWRAYGEGYAKGKYILENTTAKLMPFNGNYFGLINNLNNRLNAIYVATSLGRDLVPTFINNGEEYTLKSQEYLYIEYTPSSTTEDGNTQTQAAVKEVYGPGTIIRPSGFATGLEAFAIHSLSNTPVKTVKFDGNERGMFSLGANEQIEIRDFAKVTLDRNSFTDSSTIYVYKNFNNCPALETATFTDGAERINNTYTLQDGEYIFYTDENKTDFAYYTSGTCVTLEGGKNIIIPKMDKIDIATILDKGPQELNWWPITFANPSDKITFQEFQYITLGPSDTLKALKLSDPNKNSINNEWQFCEDVSYLPAGDESATVLPKINVPGRDGNGWEVCSILELNVSANSIQTLRKTNKVTTSVTLRKTDDTTIELQAANEESPLSFKTNLPCQSGNGKVKIGTIYNNPNNLKSLELKVFSEKAPAVLRTKPFTVIPYDGTTSFTPSEFVDVKTYREFWNQLNLATLTKIEGDNYESALKLSVSLLPYTYGVFSIYLDYKKSLESEITAETWIELMPGSAKIVEVLNTSEQDWQPVTDGITLEKLMLKPGLNCIKVTDTCDLFIKTSTSSAGTLYFDDLRLVDASPIKYIEEGIEKSYNTQGLNLSQIGYLDASEDGSKSFNVFDMRLRKNRLATYAKDANEALTARELELNGEFKSHWDSLIADKAKVEKLRDFISKVISELNVHPDGDSLKNLINAYKTFSSTLKQEIDLKDALEANANIDILEQRLITLLEGFTNIETSKETLLVQLNELYELAVTNAENLATLSENEVIADFITSADSINEEALIEKLKFDNLARINTLYNEQLAPIVNRINEAAGASEAIKTAIENLQFRRRAELRNQIKSLTEIEQAIIEETINSIITAVGGNEIDYAEVANQLVVLQTQVKNLDIDTIIARIEFAADESLYEDLAELVNKLRALLVAGDTSLTKAIDSLLTVVQAKTTTTKDPAIVSAANAIKTTIESTHESRIENILKELDTTVEALNYSDIQSQLEGVTDEQVKDFAAELAAVVATRSDYVAIVENFGLAENFNLKTDYLTLPFGQEAVTTVWAEYIKQAIICKAAELYAKIRATIKTLSTTDVSAPSELVAKVLNWVAFQKVLKQAEDLADESIQVAARKELIENLADYIALPTEIDITQTTQNKVLYSICSQLKNQTELSVAEKQELITKLKEELAKAIELDKQLVEISARYVCPSILWFDGILPEAGTDEFYATLKSYISDELTGISAEILANAEDVDELNDIFEGALYDFTAASSIIEDLAEILDITDISSFKQRLNSLDVNTLNNVFLPDTVTNTIESCKDLNTKVAQLNKVRNCNLLKYSSNENLVVAWQETEEIEETEERWRDSVGNSFEQYEDQRWFDENGYWQYTVKNPDDNPIKVKVDVKCDISNNWYVCVIDSGEVEYKSIIAKEGTSWVCGYQGAADRETIQLDDTTTNEILSHLLEAVISVQNSAAISEAFKEAFMISELEKQLLHDIQAIDKDRKFYYNVPIEANVAIDFNESETKFNTLMNPRVNYDINNVNNSFVISKLDINYLTKGLQIARSSRIN